jgi:hypothetical protein
MHVVSIGTHCYTASLLHRMNLRAEAGPFDWLFSTPEMIADCLEDDCDRLLDAKYHKRIPPERRANPKVQWCDHTYYHDKYQRPDIFNHHDITEPEVYLTFKRRVSRFLEWKREGALFVMVSRQWPINPETASRIVAASKPAAALIIGIRQNAESIRLRPKEKWIALWVPGQLNGRSFSSGEFEAITQSLINAALVGKGFESGDASLTT